ncbi:MAG: xylulokinase [Firmicutes bacterium]|nr:xylulokinase [Bacillota bacterium]
MELLAGIDVGTSGTKTVLIDPDGRTVASSFVEYPLSQPHPGWAEQDPEEWWSACCESLRQVLERSGASPGDVLGVGLSGQMHGAVLLDRDGEVLRPAIIWCDTRSSEQCEAIEKIIGRDEVIRLTSNPALPNFTATKVLWVKDHEPENYAKISKVLLPKDYIRYRLTGKFMTEVSDASGTLFLDVGRRRWSEEMLLGLGVPLSWLPEVHESPVVSARVSAPAAAATGLLAGTPVAGGAGDQAAGAVGNGIVKPGIVSSTIGTSGVVFAFTEDIKTDELGRLHSFCHAVPGKWHVMGVTQAAGGSLQWFRNNFGQLEVETGKLCKVDPYELLTQEAARVDPGCEGLVYLPYLMGERTPHLDPRAKGVFFGITARHGKPHFVRAVMEGVTFSLKDCLGLIERLGIPVSEVRASGGGARSRLWQGMQADVFDKRVVTVSATEGPALGVALLAGVGVGVYESVEAACDRVIGLGDALEPDSGRAAVYAGWHRIYGELYEQLRVLFRQADSLATGIESPAASR